jgi:eukaryotic-like serine/threonine-protein kinase
LTTLGVGDVIAGRYRLDRTLGKGGMGEVWAATHTVTQRTHALKVLTDPDADEGTRRRVMREARAASAVRHDHVVEVHDVIEGPQGSPVIVMDLLEGESLGARLEREGTIAPEEVVRVGCAVLSALEAAHALGIIHRDLKPDNVFLVSRAGGPPQPKLLDFGIAKLTATDGPARATHLLTESGAMMGTPSYMAPEQAFGEGELDARADLWSLGAIFYECLSGARPAEGATVGQVLKALATGAITPLCARDPSLPPALTSLVDRMLAIEPSARPASARDVRVELEAVDLDARAAPGEHAAPRASDGVMSAAVVGDGVPAASSRRRSIALALVAATLAVVGAAVVAREVVSPAASRADPAAPAVRDGADRAETPAPEPIAALPATPSSSAALDHVAATSASPSAARPKSASRAPGPRPDAPSRPKPSPTSAPSGGSRLLTEPPF